MSKGFVSDAELVSGFSDFAKNGAFYRKIAHDLSIIHYFSVTYQFSPHGDKTDIRNLSIREEIMNVSTNYSVSYTELSSGSMSIKGQDQQQKKQTEDSSSVKQTGMDTVSISSYKIGSNTVSKSEFDQYDSNGDGQISQDELAAYEADQDTSETSETDDTADSASASAIDGLTLSGESTEEALLSGMTSVDTYA